MALRDQPYLPLYIQDFLTDEKLNECSAAATGLYIKIMCLMHKNDPYGKILLKQKDKQNGEQILDFASKFARILPYDLPTILSALRELISEKVVYLDGDFLCQKRMIRDNEISLIRSNSGSRGGKKTQEKNKIFAKANDKSKKQANSEYENEYNIGSNDIEDINNSLVTYDHVPGRNTFLPVYEKMMEVFLLKFSNYFRDEEKDFAACSVIVSKIEKYKGWEYQSALNGHLSQMLDFWRELVDYIAGDSFLRKMDLLYHSGKGWQRLGQHMTKVENPELDKKPKKDPTEGMSDYQKDLHKKREAARNKKG